MQKMRLPPVKNELKAAEAVYANAQAEVQNAKDRITKAEQNVAAKQKAYEDAVAFEQNASAQIAKGSMGFFEKMGSTDAVSALKNATYASYTNIGAANDATSLENMKQALAFMKECNDLRANHGLAPLKVTDYLMAVSQSNTNWSDNNLAHSGQFDVGENLAWGYADPFAGWYTKEKKLYDEGERDFSKVGHYHEHY